MLQRVLTAPRPRQRRMRWWWLAAPVTAMLWGFLVGWGYAFTHRPDAPLPPPLPTVRCPPSSARALTDRPLRDSQHQIVQTLVASGLLRGVGPLPAQGETSTAP